MSEFSTKTEFSLKDIKMILPHRYPLLLIDRIVKIIPGKSITSIKNITFNEPQFQGHFPNTPIMPGIMIVEAMAQTAAVMVGVGLNLVDKEMLIYFMAIDKCKFRRKVIPGDQLKMKMNTVRGKPGGKVWKFYGEATVDGEMAAEAEFTAMMDLSSTGE